MGGSGIHVSIIPSPTLQTQGFKPVEAHRINMRTRSETWKDVLKANGIVMDTRKYCLRSWKGALHPDDKVNSYIQTFKRRVGVYTVHLVEKARTYEKKSLENTEDENVGFSRKVVPVPIPNMAGRNNGLHSVIPSAFVRSCPTPSVGVPETLRAEKNRYPDVTVSLATDDDCEKGGQYEVEEEDAYPEEYYLIDPSEMKGNQGLGDGADVEEFDDTASQFSQDSQMDLDDIRDSAVARLERTPNSVCAKVRDEIRILKQRHNYMKISGYIPGTINLLTHLFEDLV